jgi:YVTN family beta-propeller protein
MGIDPQSQYVYVVNEFSNSVSGLAIASTGGLVPLPGSPYSLEGSKARSIVVDPAGELVYVASAGSNSISGFRIAERGALTAISGSPFLLESGAYSLAIDPSGQFVFAVPGPSTVSSITPLLIRRTGALSPVCGSAVSATDGWGAKSAIVDPSGKLVYVANAESNSVSGYIINPNSGALTAVAGSPFAAGSGPVAALMVVANGQSAERRAVERGKLTAGNVYASSPLALCQAGMKIASTPRR